MNLTLRSLELVDLETLHLWLNLEHLFPFYMQEPISTQEVLTKFRPRVGGRHRTKCLFACIDSIPFGYVQWYLNRAYPDYGAAVLGREFGFSIDYFIGEPDYLGKALGAPMLKLLVEHTFPLVNESDRIACIAHDDLNYRAIRCTKRAGFKEDGRFIDKGKSSTIYCFS